MEQITKSELLMSLPLLLNSTLAVERVIELAMNHARRALDAEAATVFLRLGRGAELTFWASQGTQSSVLKNQKMPGGKGIVGWVIDNQESALVADVDSDPRFFKSIDLQSGFKTRNLICTPLIPRGHQCIGAIQVLNRNGAQSFDPTDLQFLEQLGSLLALAIENARLYQTLEEKKRELEVIDRRKNEMISVLAHEIRTPLTLIQGSAELLIGGGLVGVPEQKRIAGTLQNGIERLLRLAGEIRNLSLLTGQGYSLTKSTIEVASLLANLERQFHQTMQIRNLSWELLHDPAVNAVHADEALLLVAMTNLISNAVRFTPDGGQVSVRVHAQCGLVIFDISDTGIGIEAKELPLIFEKFYEVKNSNEHTSGSYQFGSSGLGLGLATVRSILDAHGASIEVESVKGQGSSFRFALPAS